MCLLLCGVDDTQRSSGARPAQEIMGWPPNASEICLDGARIDGALETEPHGEARRDSTLEAGSGFELGGRRGRGAHRSPVGSCGAIVQFEPEHGLKRMR